MIHNSIKHRHWFSQQTFLGSLPWARHNAGGGNIKEDRQASGFSRSDVARQTIKQLLSCKDQRYQMVINTIKNIKQDDVLENFTDPKLMSYSEANVKLVVNHSKTMKYDIHQKEVWVSTQKLLLKPLQWLLFLPLTIIYWLVLLSYFISVSGINLIIIRGTHILSLCSKKKTPITCAKEVHPDWNCVANGTLGFKWIKEKSEKKHREEKLQIHTDANRCA